MRLLFDNILSILIREFQVEGFGERTKMEGQSLGGALESGPDLYYVTSLLAGVILES